MGRGLAAALRDIFVETDRQFIFLIDEWDCVMREQVEAEHLQRHYLNFLQNLLKDQPYKELSGMAATAVIGGQHDESHGFPKATRPADTHKLLFCV